MLVLMGYILAHLAHLGHISTFRALIIARCTGEAAFSCASSPLGLLPQGRGHKSLVHLAQRHAMHMSHVQPYNKKIVGVRSRIQHLE